MQYLLGQYVRRVSKATSHDCELGSGLFTTHALLSEEVSETKPFVPTPPRVLNSVFGTEAAVFIRKQDMAR